MSENTNETTTTNAAGLLIRRVALVVISLVLGIVLTYFCVTADFLLNTTIGDYGPIYTFFTVLTIACGFAIWLDHERVLNTKILPH